MPDVGFEPYENLINAVIVQAANDYRSALKKNDQYEINNLERFFRYGLVMSMSDVDGRYLIQAIRAEVKEKTRKKHGKKNRERKPETAEHSDRS